MHSKTNQEIENIEEIFHNVETFIIQKRHCFAAENVSSTQGSNDTPFWTMSNIVLLGTKSLKKRNQSVEIRDMITKDKDSST